MMNEFVGLVESGNYNGAVEVFIHADRTVRCEIANHRFAGGDTCLHIFENCEHVSHFIGYCRINDQNDRGTTPLMKAVMRRNLETVRLLISHGADINTIMDRGNHTPLTISSEWAEGFEEILKTKPKISEQEHSFISFCSSDIIRRMLVHMKSEGCVTNHALMAYMAQAISHDDIDLADEILNCTQRINLQRWEYNILSGEMASFLACRGVMTESNKNFSIGCALKYGLMDVIRIHLLYYRFEYEDFESMTHSPKHREIFELVLAVVPHEELCQFIPYLLNSERTDKIEDIVHMARVSRLVPNGRPSLRSMCLFEIQSEKIREEMKALRLRIEDSRVAGDWRSILQFTVN